MEFIGERGDFAGNGERAKSTVVKLVRGTSGFDVTTKEPHKLIRLVLGLFRNTFVVVVGLDLLCMLEFCSKVSMDMLETLSKIMSSRDCVSFSDLGFERRMISEVGEEGSLFGGGILCVVEGELSDWKVVYPVVLLVGTVGTKVCFEGLVGTFSKSIGLGMVSCGQLVIDLEHCGEFFPEV